MNLLAFLVISFVVLEISCRRLNREIPHLVVEDGNLIFYSAYNKNITFKTTPSAGVSINNIDLLTTLDKAYSATKLLDNYQTAFASYVDRIDSIDQRVSDMPVRWSNATDSSLMLLSVRRLRRSFTTLLRRVNEIEAAILQDDCVDNPCKNGGICQDMYKNYICHCTDGWQGTNCLEDVNECSKFAGTDLGCQNGATCYNKPGSYECLCREGFFGIHCNRRKADCSTGGQELCGHGTCVQQNNQLGYKCICDQGWTTDGKSQPCTVDVDECNLNHPACSRNPTVPCINVPGSFHCGSCPSGYKGNGYYCTDINECDLNNGGCSTNPMVNCINTQGSRTCGLCPPGYEGDGITCSYKGVCNVNNGNCHRLARCMDNPRISSTYVECTCPPGYVGNGIGPNGCSLSSHPLNPCAPNPCINGDCSVNNATGDYICRCKKKFTGRNCDIMNDPCGSNPCFNGGTCRNIIGISFQCICLSGFSGALCETEAPACGGRLSGLNGTLTYPPDDYTTSGHRISCSWTIQTNATKILNITFSKFDMEKGCRSSWLQIHDGRNSAARPLGRFCGNDLPMGGNILTTHNIIYLWFTTNARNFRNEFKLTWNSKNPACGGIIRTTTQGSIESPGSPGNYPPNRDCYWVIKSPMGKRLLLQFYSLNIGNNTDCNQDYIEFNNLYGRDGAFAKICNSSILAPIYSPAENVRVHFHSDAENSYPGFQMTYVVVEGTPGCGGIYTSMEGVIHSPQTDHPTLCEYKIQKIFNVRTKITFLSLDIEQTPGCTRNYVEVREGPDATSPLVGRYCGTTLPEPRVTSDTITVISSILVNSKWKIQYKRICGSKFSNNTGSFDSPPVGALNNDCIYQIELPLEHIIELTITVTSRLLQSLPCSSNYVEIRDGDNENAKVIKKMCMTGTEIITSTHNHLWIRYFRTVNTQNAVSFKATYSSTKTGCGGILREKMGNIVSPAHAEDGYYPSSLKCTWTIIAPPKFVIQLTWLTFSLEQSFECLYDNVKVYDSNGNLENEGLIGKYCGSTVPPILLTSSNIMTIVFTSDITINMDGFLATYMFVPDSNVCGGNYYTSTGVIKSPGYPENYPPNKQCTWTITVPSGQQILLNVTDFRLEEFDDCRYDYLEIRNGGTLTSPLVGKYCDTKIPKQIPSHTNILYLHFNSDPSRPNRGFLITWTTTATGCGGVLTSLTGSITSPQYPEPYSRNTECTWKIIVGHGLRIQVIFSDIDLEQNVQCQGNFNPDYVELFDGLTLNSKSLGKFCYKEEKPILSSGHEMLIKFRSDIAYQGRGFQLHYSTICNNTFRGYKGVIQSPNFPERYSKNLNCWWNIVVSDRNKINITFSDFEIEDTYLSLNKTCNSDYLEIKYLELTSDYYEVATYTQYGKYCGDKNPGHFTINSDHVQIHFVSDNWIASSGFRLEWQLFGCGARLTHNSGQIQSPNYPSPYPPSVKCEWQIEVDFGYRIEIEFHEIDIEKDNCDYDWIQVYNGPDNSSNVISKMCHQVKPIVLSSTGNQMFIDFQADHSYQGRGFSANYSVVSTKCGGKFTAIDGIITSPNYPNNFDGNDTCFWFIEIDDGHSIELNFEDVDLPANCDKFYIKVYDGPTEAYPVLKKVCEKAPNETIISTFNEMYIEFRTSNTYFTTKGFKAHYKKACGSRITTQGSGQIQVTRNDFSDLTNCTWTIASTDPSRHITLTVTQMYMYIYSCEDETPIKIFGGETIESPLLKTYCGSKLPPPLVSDGSAITIQIQQEMDFFATYSVLDSHCGGTFTALNGFFASPGYPKKYPFDLQCEWTITVASGNHLTLTFIEFDILESEKCNTDFLEIRKNNVSGPLLGVYCGKNKPSNLTHEGTLWMMFKGSKSDGSNIASAKGFYGEYELNYDNELTGSQGTIASPLYPQVFQNYASFSWKITVASRKRILLTFKEFNVESEEAQSEESYCFSSEFKVYDGVDNTAPLLKSLCGLTLPNPIKSSSNIIYILVDYNYVRMGSTFVVDWLEISDEPSVSTSSPENECGSSVALRTKMYTLTSPGYPYGYKNNLNCSWIFSTISRSHLNLQFVDLTLNGFMVHSRFGGDYVNLYQKHPNDNDWELVKKVGAVDDTITPFALTNLIKVEFITNSYANGTGFKAQVIPVCGGSMTESSGYIEFEKSLFRLNCEWNVTVRSGKTIKVTFESMDITYDPSKRCDNYLLLKNGKYKDSPILGNGKYCGTAIPKPLNTTANHLYVKYYGSTNIKGFKLKYEEISLNCENDILLSLFDNSTEINSPNYPNMPPSHIKCTWIIRAPPEKSLRIDFEERFDLTKRKECDIEYVEVRDGGTEYSPLIGRYCDTAPSTQFSSSNIMFVKFFTDTGEPRDGFKAKISLAYCGGTVRSSEGEIRNPTVYSTEPNRNCTWHIIGLMDHYLNIQFTTLNLSVSRQYGNNKITILEKNSFTNNVTRLAAYIGTVAPPLITTLSNEAIINYAGTDEDRFLLKFNSSQSECGGVLEIDSGTIVSPGYPSMSHLKRMCKWSIKVPEGRRITIDFVDLDFDETAMFDQFVLIFEGTYAAHITLGYIKPGSPRRNFETSSNEMMLIFFSNRSSPHRGFKAKFSSNKPTICSSDFSGNSGVITQPTVRNSSYYCHWEHNSQNYFFNQTFALTINLETNSTRKQAFFNCSYSQWYITAVNPEKQDTLVSLCMPSIKNYIVRSPFLITKVVATSKIQMNFSISYNTYKCGGIINAQDGSLSSPNYPNKPSQSVECAWLLKVDKDQTINITIINMSMGSDCDKSFIAVYNGDGPLEPRIGKYCKDKPSSIVSEGNSLWIEYKYDTQSTGTGFELKYEAKSGGCGGIFHDKTRTLETPFYGQGQEYPNNAECLWEIWALPGYSIKLDFIGRFQIEDSDNCVNDYIQIWDWKLNKWVLTSTKCGREVPTDVRSTGNRLRILFRSNDKITASGFKAKWTWICGGTFEASKTPQTIVSPGYPLLYKSNLTCVYNITTKADVVNLIFDDFELEEGTSACMYDNVTISGKYFSTHMLLRASYCGVTKPPPLRMRENIIITFRTDQMVNSKGFKFTFSDESCGGYINETSIIELASIGYQKSLRYFNPRIRCVWNITAPPKQVVVLRILHLRLLYACYGRNFEIYNGTSDKLENKLVSLCGNITDSYPIHADSGRMVVKLESNPVHFNGFKAQVYFSHGPAEGCGGTINLTQTKYISSPNLEDLDCVWKIVAPRDYQIQIQFTELNIPGVCAKNSSFVYCTCSFVEVRDGGGPLSELMEKLCSDANTSPEYRKYTTSLNMAYIRLVLDGVQNNAFRATLTPILSKCGASTLNATGEIKTLTSPNYPNKYPPSIKCHWIISTNNSLEKIELHFVDFNITENSAIEDYRCSNDRLEIMEDPNLQIITQGYGPQAMYNPSRRTINLGYNNVQGKNIFCGVDKYPFDYYSIGKSLTLTFRSYLGMDQSKGFKLEYRVAGCNRNYTSLQGRLFSTYGQSDCIITITVPENRTISLYFQRFALYSAINCSSGAFEVRDSGPSGTLLTRSCGVRIPDPVFSFTNKLYISIKRQHSVSYDVVYTSTDAGRGCGGKIYNYKGRLSSPNYPNEFRNTTECSWSIQVPVGLHVALKFISFDLQGACDQTFVNVITYSDGITKTNQFCKDDQPAIQRSEDSKIDIVYSSSVHNGGTGWLVQFQGVESDVSVA